MRGALRGTALARQLLGARLTGARANGFGALGRQVIEDLGNRGPRPGLAGVGERRLGDRHRATAAILEGGARVCRAFGLDLGEPMLVSLSPGLSDLRDALDRSGADVVLGEVGQFCGGAWISLQRLWRDAPGRAVLIAEYEARTGSEHTAAFTADPVSDRDTKENR